MGGGPKPVNSGQSAVSAADAHSASSQSLSQAQYNQNLQKRMVDTLFGNGGAGSTGSLTKFLDPKLLDSANLSGAYKSGYNQSTNQLAKDYSNQKGSLAQSWANRGMGSGSTPSGFQADQERKLGSSEADTRGQMFTGALGQQHGEALSNFWNANNVASGNAANSSGAAAKNAEAAGSTAANIFSTAGKQAQTGTSAQTGITEAALCPTSGMKILMADKTWKPVEELQKGDNIFGLDGVADQLIEVELSRPQHVCDVATNFRSVRVSVTHCFERTAGGYAIAGSSKGDEVQTMNGTERIVSVDLLAELQVCYRLSTRRAHGYVVEGFFSLE